jgi:hypothetical protein
MRRARHLKITLANLTLIAGVSFLERSKLLPLALTILCSPENGANNHGEIPEVAQYHAANPRP